MNQKQGVEGKVSQLREIIVIFEFNLFKKCYVRDEEINSYLE